MTYIETLQHIRETPRRMRGDYLIKMGVKEQLQIDIENNPEIKQFKFKEQLDWFIAGSPANRCYCGGLLKIGAQYCSAACVGRAIETKEKLGKVQRDNAASRVAKCQTTMLRKYGVKHNTQLASSNEKRASKRAATAERISTETFAKYGLDINNYKDPVKLQEIIDANTSLVGMAQNAFNGMPVMTLWRYLGRFNLRMFPKSCSGGERELAKFVATLGEIDTSNRTLIKPLELDIVCDNRKIAIEFNGIYWHSAEKVGVNYHKNKTDRCAELGYQLLQVYENEWECKRDIVESIIRAKFGLCTTIQARKCAVKRIDSAAAKSFFEATHIQGHAAANLYYGLFYQGELVSCISMGKPRFTKESDWELIRYSSKLNMRVVGGFGKMLTAFKRLHAGTILTYCDRRYSNGKTYEKFGALLRTTQPGYHWTKLDSGVCLSRYQTQKHKLAKLLPDHYSVEMPEDAIMESAGYFKIFDCGHLVYSL